MANDLAAKARRAAEWIREKFPTIGVWETNHGKWNVYEQALPIGMGERLIWGELSPSMLVAFAKDNGWVDSDSECRPTQGQKEL